MTVRWTPPFWVGDREFSADDAAHIRTMVHQCRRLTRQEIAATICENLPWIAPNGRLKITACRQLLAQWEVVGRLELPPGKNMRPAHNRDTDADPAPLIPGGNLLGRTSSDSDRPGGGQRTADVERNDGALPPPWLSAPFGASQRYWIRGQHGGQRVIPGRAVIWRGRQGGRSPGSLDCVDSGGAIPLSMAHCQQ